MIRPELIMEGRSGECFYKFLENIGGELYTNCYTPAPDTTRSLACFWSGVEPKKNLCDVREKWPKYNLNHRYSDIVSSLQNKGVNLKFFHEPNEVEVGVLPRSSAKSDIFGSYDLRAFTSSCKPLDNSFTYIGIQDFHISFNTHGYDDWGVQKAFGDLIPTINILAQFIDNNSFDHIFIFSDHGFLTDSERLYAGNYLSKKRNQILLFHHDVSSDSLKTGVRANAKFCSIMSLRPSIECLFGVTSTSDDYPIWSSKERGDIYLEDHQSYQPCVNHSFEYWGVIRKTGAIDSCTLSEVFKDGKRVTNIEELADEIRHELSENTSLKNYVDQNFAIQRHREWMNKVKENNTLSTNIKSGKASILRKAIRKFEAWSRKNQS